MGLIQSGIKLISPFGFLLYQSFVKALPRMVYKFLRGSVLQVKSSLKIESQRLRTMTLPEDEQYGCHRRWEIHQCPHVH